MKHNPLRGALELSLQGSDLVLCADLESTAAFEAAMGNITFLDVQRHLQEGSVRAAKAVLSSMVLQGDAKALLSKLTHADVVVLCNAGLLAFAAQFPEPEDDDGKKPEGEPETK